MNKSKQKNVRVGSRRTLQYRLDDEVSVTPVINTLLMLLGEYFVNSIYLWRDKARNMYYVGSHVGSITDGYVLSSNWLDYEIRYRPQDFSRKIIKTLPESELLSEEYRIIKMIKSEEFGRKYYNLRSGRKKGCIPYNKGTSMSEEQKQKLSNSKRGSAPWNLGKSNPTAAQNGKTGAAKISKTIIGRKMIIVDGIRKWAYPSEDGWYIKVGEKSFLLSQTVGLQGG